MTGICAHARLLVDIASIALLVRLLGRHGELLDSHLFFFDRYSELADYHRLKGRVAKAERFAAVAEAHWKATGDEDPPAAAMAMPVPWPPVNVTAIGKRMPRSSDGTPSSLVPSPST